MKKAVLKYTVLSTLVSLAAIVFVLAPFHAVLTVWLSSLVGHYTWLRLWKEFILIIAAIGALYLMLADRKIRTHTLTRRLVWLIIFYGIVQILTGLYAVSQDEVTWKALGYGLIVNLRFLAFFLITWAVALRTARLHKNWPKLALWPAVVVVLFGMLQILVLPHDFLRHFGYGPSTIYPFETINHNPHYIRIQSTLRGANPLGAYLIIPIALWAALLYKRGWSWLRAGLMAASGVVLIYSFSRAAWLGAIVAVAASALICWPWQKLLRPVGAAAIILLFAAGGFWLGFHDNARVQNLILHTDNASSIKHSSNDGHLSALASGVHDVVTEPLGRGVGTAGPASVYNDRPARISENYFLQIGQESGWLGLIVFVIINIGVGYLLWLRRESALALGLFGSLLGISLVGMLSHVWTDDTVAYVWWGLAGIAMVQLPELPPKEYAEEEPDEKPTSKKASKRAVKAKAA